MISDSKLKGIGDQVIRLFRSSQTLKIRYVPNRNPNNIIFIVENGQRAGEYLISHETIEDLQDEAVMRIYGGMTQYPQLRERNPDGTPRRIALFTECVWKPAED